eukprot:COSAG04_NODE_543_length_12846_cov_7.281556_4_plen_371_part_00
MTLSRFGPSYRLADQKPSPFQAGAVWINGRAGHPVPADTSRQNWESGIAWTMRSCTFFRNSGIYAAADIETDDVWPLELLYEDTHFIQGQTGIFVAHDFTIYWPLAGSERRVGFSSFDVRSCLFVGGYDAQGLSAIHGSYIGSIDTNDDPDAIFNVTYESTTYEDHGANLWGIVLGVQIWPPQSNELRQWNVRFVNLQMRDTNGLSPGDNLDGAYVATSGLTGFLVERSRFEANGIVDSSARGMGGCQSKMVMLSRVVALSASLTLKASLLQCGRLTVHWTATGRVRSSSTPNGWCALLVQLAQLMVLKTFIAGQRRRERSRCGASERRWRCILRQLRHAIKHSLPRKSECFLDLRTCVCRLGLTRKSIA